VRIARIYLRVNTAEQDLSRQADTAAHQRIVVLRSAGQTIERTDKLAGCSVSQVKRSQAGLAACVGSEGCRNDESTVAPAAERSVVWPDFLQPVPLTLFRQPAGTGRRGPGPRDSPANSFAEILHQDSSGN